MKIICVIPDRNDRPTFTENMFRMLESQTLQPCDIVHVNFTPEPDIVDLTKRYRIGYELASKQNPTLIAFIENDDWYHPQYLEVMANQWLVHNKPDIFGTNYTIYYHLYLNRWLIMNHKRRSSAMSTVLKPKLQINWGNDTDVYTDICLWEQLQNRATFKPNTHICMGIKHGIGMCGGLNHVDRLNRYKFGDGLSLLKNTLDAQSYSFYTSIPHKFPSKF